MKYKRCKHIKANGEQCKARAMKGSQYCFFHNPKTKAKVSEAGRKGGEKRKIKILPESATDFNVDSHKDIICLLSTTINQVRKGLIDTRIANAIGYLSGILLKAKDQGILEERLLRIENELKKRGNQNVD